MGRAPCCDKANVKRGPWSPEEDSILKNYLENNGTGGNWISLPQKAGLKRCGKSCRLRWLNYLRPDIKHGGFTEEEDNIICGLYSNIGSRWSVIASQLQGRTDNDVKNYWNTKLKKKYFAAKLSYNNNNNNTQASNINIPKVDYGNFTYYNEEVSTPFERLMDVSNYNININEASSSSLLESMNYVEDDQGSLQLDNFIFESPYNELLQGFDYQKITSEVVVPNLSD